MSIRNEKVYDHWRVGIVEAGGNERFVILFVNSAKWRSFGLSAR
jgi:hypothetical protein